MAFVYRAIAFPFQKGATEFPQSSTDNDLIKQALVQLVMTGVGERVMRPSVGTSVVAYIFANMGPETEGLIREDISSVIAKYEPRVNVTSINLSSEDTTVVVVINYVVLATNQNQTLTLNLGQV